MVGRLYASLHPSHPQMIQKFATMENQEITGVATISMFKHANGSTFILEQRKKLSEESTRKFKAFPNLDYLFAFFLASLTVDNLKNATK